MRSSQTSENMQVYGTFDRPALHGSGKCSFASVGSKKCSRLSPPTLTVSASLDLRVLAHLRCASMWVEVRAVPPCARPGRRAATNVATASCSSRAPADGAAGRTPIGLQSSPCSARAPRTTMRAAARECSHLAGRGGRRARRAACLWLGCVTSVFHGQKS